MPWIKISSETHKDMKQYLVDVEGLSLGELTGAAFEYAMQHLEEFEKFLGLEGNEEDAKGQEEEAESEGENENEEE